MSAACNGWLAVARLHTVQLCYSSDIPVDALVNRDRTARRLVAVCRWLARQWRIVAGWLAGCGVLNGYHAAACNGSSALCIWRRGAAGGISARQPRNRHRISKLRAAAMRIGRLKAKAAGAACPCGAISKWLLGAGNRRREAAESVA